MAKLFVRISGAENEVALERAGPGSPWRIKDAPPADIARIGPAQFSVVIGGRSHRVLVIKEDKENRALRLRVGGATSTVKVVEEHDRLLDVLGLDKAVRKAGDLKAPMPGLVLSVLVKPGDSVRKNDPVLVLEAMKMENVIRAPGDAVVKAVPAEQGKPVEKGQLLVQFG
ncbi:MAG: biotin/lipoyl-containing protein [Flavobacteriales bacterium]